MPSSISVARYPEGMLDVIESVVETGRPCDIAYTSTKIAKNERLRFYGLIRALNITKHSLGTEAVKLELRLYGEDRKNPNILRIGYPTGKTNEFYKKVAEQHAEAAKPPSDAN